MKTLRVLVLLTMTSLVPSFLTSAVAQQEIDPDHFDQAELAKKAKPVIKPKASPRAAAVKDQRKSTSGAAKASPTGAGSRQAKAENQRMAAVHSTGE